MTRQVVFGRIAKLIMSGSALLALPGCLTLQVIEPVMEPPRQFTADVTVPVEFAVPGTIGFRCAERGATFFGLPGINSGACADRTLVTMLDPCLTLTAGPYAQTLCEGLRQHRIAANPVPNMIEVRAAQPVPGLVKASFSVSSKPAAPAPPSTRELSAWENVIVEFVDAGDVEMRCAERGAKLAASDAAVLSCADRLMLTVVNPCTSEEQGWYTRTLCHELAHVNGWPADHPAHYQHMVLKPASESPQALALAKAMDAASYPVTIAVPDPATITARPVLVAAPLLAPPVSAPPAPAPPLPAPPVSAADFPVGLRKIVANVVSFSLSWRAQTSLAVETRMKAVASLFALPQPAADIPTANGSTAGERADIKVSYKSGDIPSPLLRGLSYQTAGLSHDPSASKQSSD
jgi:hypothetical protein